MKAAVYARKSTLQADVAEEARSTTRQIDGARAFIVAQGWTLDDVHVYTDEGISGALFSSRGAFQKLMSDAAAGAWDALVFYDLDRFGRNARLTMEALNTLTDHGIGIWDYSTGRQLDLDSLEGEMMTFMRARFAQQEREQGRKRTRDSMRRKAEQGLVTGGTVFGYENQRLGKGQTIRVIYEPEAAVVREIFERAATGEGLRSIAAALNTAKAPSPRAQKGRWNGWSQSTVREVLRRPLYRGELIWGRTACKYGRELPKGDKREMAQIVQPEESWVKLPVNESLRIVDPELAVRVDARHTERRARYFSALAVTGTRVPERTHGKYLLTGGMLVCPTCKGHFEAIKYPQAAYVCATRRRKPGSCPNYLTLPMEDTDRIVLDMLEGDVLGTNFVEELLGMVDQGQLEDRSRLASDRERLRGEVENLIRSIAAGVPAETVAPGIRARELEISRLEVRLRAPVPEAPRIDELREALLQRAEDWRTTLRTEPHVARVLVRRLIGPLVLYDESTRPDFVKADAVVKPGLLEGIVPHGAYNRLASPENPAGDVYTRMASPPGFEPGFQP
jgi:DNA invertase Pin-like site-specific DNA recombinase